MAQNPRRVVAELTKVWDQVVTKGKEMGLNHNLNKVEVTEPQGVSSKIWGINFNVPSSEKLVNKVKDKVNSSMSAYEDFIGIKQVKEAHSRVLEAELKFVRSQNGRRGAHASLVEVQNQLRLLRGEIDRTARGDDRYLELIKKEIEVIREERFLRAQFEELEKGERENFSELSNSLRFSHEKERAQNEKTKYWSVLGSIIGAFLGIVGTTINSRLKQQQTKEILTQTSSQVLQIEETVRQLAEKIDNSLEIDNQNSKFLISGKLADAFIQFNESFENREEALSKKTDALIAATNAVEIKLNNLLMNIVYHEDSGLDPGIQSPRLITPGVEQDYIKYRPKDKEMWVTTLGLIILGVIAYKFY